MSSSDCTDCTGFVKIRIVFPMRQKNKNILLMGLKISIV